MHQFLRKAKVNELEVSIGIDEHIFRLHISVRNALMIVEEFEDEHHFGNVEAGCILIKARSPPKVGKDLASRAVVELRWLA